MAPEPSFPPTLVSLRRPPYTICIVFRSSALAFTMASYSFVLCGLAAYIAYLVWLAIYRLHLSPLAKFPGPKLAALSNWYEFYYDVIREGDFTRQIQKLHKKYGKTTYATPRDSSNHLSFDWRLYSLGQRRSNPPHSLLPPLSPPQRRITRPASTENFKKTQDHD